MYPDQLTEKYRYSSAITSSCFHIHENKDDTEILLRQKGFHF